MVWGGGDGLWGCVEVWCGGHKGRIANCFKHLCSVHRVSFGLQVPSLPSLLNICVRCIGCRSTSSHHSPPSPLNQEDSVISNSERKATAPSGASQPARPSTPGPLTDDSDRIVRDEEVQRLVGLSRSTIWRE